MVLEKEGYQMRSTMYWMIRVVMAGTAMAAATGTDMMADAFAGIGIGDSAPAAIAQMRRAPDAQVTTRTFGVFTREKKKCSGMTITECLSSTQSEFAAKLP